jgi:hypothetical protein
LTAVERRFRLPVSIFCNARSWVQGKLRMKDAFVNIRLVPPRSQAGDIGTINASEEAL